MDHHLTTLALAGSLARIACAQPAVAPPVGTDLNAGVPPEWTIETPFDQGWTWQSAAGVGGSGGLLMDCGTCTTPQETTLWTPWLDLTTVPTTALHFDCAIIGGSMGVPPPIWLRGDAGTGPVYIQNYGFAGLLPPPNEVILSTIDPSPPLDLGAVQWVSIDYPISGGPLADSVRLGIAAVVPLDGYALLDNVYIDGPSTAVDGPAAQVPLVHCANGQLLIAWWSGLNAVDVFDGTGRSIAHVDAHGATRIAIPIGDLPPGPCFVRMHGPAGDRVVRTVVPPR